MEDGSFWFRVLGSGFLVMFVFKMALKAMLVSITIFISQTVVLFFPNALSLQLLQANQHLSGLPLIFS